MQVCILTDFTTSSLQAQFEMSCPLQFHYGQWSHCPPKVKSYRVCNHPATAPQP